MACGTSASVRPGLPAPAHQPNNRKRPTEGEEKQLRALAPPVNEFLDRALATRSGVARHHFVRELYALSQNMTHSLLVQTLERALRYGITDIGTLRRIARLSAQQVQVHDSFCEREAYQEGRLSEAPDLSVDEQRFEDDDEDEEDPHG
jgi:hypothetical protein